ncbi:MAG: GAF domain-containing protein [Myxococcales bacterium]|nr:GAF domain-containing protein [Myxococcales bacterium]
MAETESELREELAREQGKLRALQEIAQTLASTLELDELFGALLRRIKSIMDADEATLFVVDEERQDLWSRCTRGGGTEEIRLRMGQGLPGWVAQNGRSLNVKDAYRDVRFDSEWDRRTGHHTTSALCVPVKNPLGRTIGVLQVLNRRSDYFKLEDESLLSSIASLVAVSLENNKLFVSVVGKNMELLETKEQLEQKVRELDVLFEIAQVSASAEQLDDLLEGALARAIHASGAEAGSILLSEADGGQLRFQAAVGGDPEAVKRLKVAPDEGICGWVATHGKPQVVNDVHSDARHSSGIAKKVGYHPRSVLCVPLTTLQGRGALELLNKGSGNTAFTDDDLKLASVIARHVSTAIDLARARTRQAQEQRLSTIGQLLSGVVHDLRGPMTVISSYARYLREQPDASELAGYGESILRQVESVNAMTGEILAFARGERRLLVSKVYLKPFFQTLTEQLRAELDGRPVELTLELSDRGTAYFDQDKVTRAVHNLVRNAAQALGPGGGHIGLAVSSVADGRLFIECRDDGPGVPEEIRSRMFESFTSHGKPEGTGLGLAIVRKVASDHGGEVRMNSRPGHTVFTLELPSRRPGVSEAPPEANSGSDQGQVIA